MTQELWFMLIGLVGCIGGGYLLGKDKLGFGAIFLLLGAMLIAVTVRMQKEISDENLHQTQLNCIGLPRQLEIGKTYDLITTDQVYTKLKGPDGVERVYAIDDKLLPSFDRWILPKLLKRFKFEQKENQEIVPIPTEKKPETK